jgi:exosortase
MPKQHSHSLPLVDEKLRIGEHDAKWSERSDWIKWTLVLLPFGCLWFRLINNLRLEWTSNPQYSYGLVVPFLCGSFLLNRWQLLSGARDRRPASTPWFVILCFAALAFLYLPTRLVEKATPEWRPIEWALGIEAIGLSLCAIYLAGGRGLLRQMAFPLCYFFVAIPWPTLVETPVIQTLTRINSAIVVELLGWINIPAMQHGNLIEVSTGTVGVSEACSGIRSFQSSLMVSLFFGDFYQMGLWRRLLLVPAGFILAMAFNVCRMSFLTIVAAKKGTAAIAVYHDPSGVLIAVVCTIGLWGLALLFKPGQAVGSIADRPMTIDYRPAPTSLFAPAVSLCIWLAAVETGTELWYRSLESHLAPSPEWSAQFPADDPTFQEVPIDADTKNLLRFDDGEQATWVADDGSRWKGFYFNWLPGRVAGYLAKRHTPEICMPAVGCNSFTGPILRLMKINGVTLPVRSYVFDTEGGPMYVFHCRWEAGVNEDAYVTHESARFNLVRGVWAGRGKFGQKILEVIITGCADSAAANAAFARRLPAMIKVEKHP